LPIGGDLSAKVTEALERFLQEHSIKASVIATMTGSLGGPAGGYDLRVSGISIPVVAVNVKGGPLGPEALAKATHVLSLSDYSRSVARGAGQSGLTDAYQDEGYLQAKFSDPQVAMKDPQDRDASLGVALTYSVAPGPQYLSNGVTWAGNGSVPESELAALMEVKPGDVARRDKLNWSWVAVQDRFGKDGYLATQVQVSPEFDAPKNQVHFQAKVTEGPQFRMGEFTATGVSEILANKLKEAWKLRTGQVYDASYESTYQHKDIAEALRQSATTRFTVTLRRKLDMQNHIVNVELEIK
jgi:outer membrane protein assembly factor BamA